MNIRMDDHFAAQFSWAYTHFLALKGPSGTISSCQPKSMGFFFFLNFIFCHGVGFDQRWKNVQVGKWVETNSGLNGFIMYSLKSVASC